MCSKQDICLIPCEECPFAPQDNSIGYKIIGEEDLVRQTEDVDSKQELMAWINWL